MKTCQKEPQIFPCIHGFLTETTRLQYMPESKKRAHGSRKMSRALCKHLSPSASRAARNCPSHADESTGGKRSQMGSCRKPLGSQTRYARTDCRRCALERVECSQGRGRNSGEEEATKKLVKTGTLHAQHFLRTSDTRGYVIVCSDATLD